MVLWSHACRAPDRLRTVGGYGGRGLRTQRLAWLEAPPSAEVDDVEQLATWRLTDTAVATMTTRSPFICVISVVLAIGWIYASPFVTAWCMAGYGWNRLEAAAAGPARTRGEDNPVPLDTAVSVQWIPGVTMIGSAIMGWGFFLLAEGRQGPGVAYIALSIAATVGVSKFIAHLLSAHRHGRLVAVYDRDCDPVAGLRELRRWRSEPRDHILSRVIAAAILAGQERGDPLRQDHAGDAVSSEPLTQELRASLRALWQGHRILWMVTTASALALACLGVSGAVRGEVTAWKDVIAIAALCLTGLLGLPILALHSYATTSYAQCGWAARARVLQDRLRQQPDTSEESGRSYRSPVARVLMRLAEGVERRAGG
jgi:hypothetical protein